MVITRVWATLLSAGALFASGGLWAQANLPQIEFVLPIECRVGSTCFIQKYVDVDPTRRYRDYQCFGLTNDGHKGTDFRLPDRTAVEAGVNVLAAADGLVKGFRDGEPDGLLIDQGPDAVQGKECGNAVVIDHGNGWETQYCHMRKDSVEAYRGKAVSAGDVIGQVGLSGSTEFAHLHFEARYQGKTIDPFTGAPALDGCGADAFPLWTQEALNGLDYTPTDILNVGFAEDTPTMDGIENGAYVEAGFAPDSPFLFYYVRIYGLRNGDTEELSVVGPDGVELVRIEETHDGTSKAQSYRFIGKRMPEGGWPVGTYEGRYQLIRGGRILLARVMPIDVAPAP